MSSYDSDPRVRFREDGVAVLPDTPGGRIGDWLVEPTTTGSYTLRNTISGVLTDEGDRYNMRHKLFDTPDAALAYAIGDAMTATNTADTTPTRQDTDRLAAELPADRTGWDGKPLDAASRRLFALREAGYSGWIDQDGYPTTGHDFTATRMDTDDDTDGA